MAVVKPLKRENGITKQFSNTDTIAMPLTNAHIFAGSALNIATDVAMSGDITIDNTGVTAISAGVIVNNDINVSAAIAVTKIAALTASRVVVTDGSGFISASSITTTTLGFLDATSSIQTQLDSKSSNTLTSAHIFVGNGSNVATNVAMSGDISIDNTGSTAIVAGVILNSDINNSAGIDATKIANGSVSNTEFQYLDGVTSAIQTQIDGKVTKGGDASAFSFGTTGAAQDVTVKLGNNDRWVFDGTNGYLRRGSSGGAYFGLQLYGTGAGSVLTFGDTFDSTTPLVSIRENGGTDTDAMEIYAKNGIYMRVSTYGGTAALFINSSSSIGLANESPTAKLHLQACSAGANNSSLKIPSGTLSTASDGAIDYDGTNYYACVSTTRYQIARCLTGSASLNFPSTIATAVSDLTITVTGAAVGDSVALGIPNGSVTATASYIAWVSSANTVTIRFSPKGIEDPASATFKVTVYKNV